MLRESEVFIQKLQSITLEDKLGEGFDSEVYRFGPIDDRYYVGKFYWPEGVDVNQANLYLRGTNVLHEKVGPEGVMVEFSQGISLPVVVQRGEIVFEHPERRNTPIQVSLFVPGTTLKELGKSLQRTKVNDDPLRDVEDVSLPVARSILPVIFERGNVAPLVDLESVTEPVTEMLRSLSNNNGIKVSSPNIKLGEQGLVVTDISESVPEFGSV